MPPLPEIVVASPPLGRRPEGEAHERSPLLGGRRGPPAGKLADLPAPLQRHICALLSEEDLGLLAATSTSLREAAQSPRLWRRQIAALDGPPLPSALRRYPSRRACLGQALASARTYLVAGAAGAALGSILGLCLAGIVASLREGFAAIRLPSATGDPDAAARGCLIVGVSTGAALGCVVGLALGSCAARDAHQAAQRQRFEDACCEGRQARRLLQSPISHAADETMRGHLESCLRAWARALARYGLRSLLGHALRTGDDATIDAAVQQALLERQEAPVGAPALGLGDYAPARYGVAALRRAAARPSRRCLLNLLQLGIPPEAADDDGTSARAVVRRALQARLHGGGSPEDLPEVLALLAALRGDVGDDARHRAVRLVYRRACAIPARRRWQGGAGGDGAARAALAPAYDTIMQGLDASAQAQAIARGIAGALAEGHPEALPAWLSFADRRREVAARVRQGALRDRLAEHLLRAGGSGRDADTLMGWGVLPRCTSEAACNATVALLLRHAQQLADAGGRRVARRTRDICEAIVADRHSRAAAARAPATSGQVPRGPGRQAQAEG